MTPAGDDPVGISWRCLMLIKLEWLCYRMVKKNYDSTLSRFIWYRNVTDGQTERRTDRRTDRIAISISRIRVLTHDKNWNSSRLGLFGPPMLEVTCYRIVSTVDAWYTNAALPRISGLAFATDDVGKMLFKNATYFAYNGLPSGLSPSNYIFRKLSSSWCHVLWHVTLRLTVFEILAVKWQKSESERPKMVHPSPFPDPAFRYPWRYRHQKWICPGDSSAVV